MTGLDTIPTRQAAAPAAGLARERPVRGQQEPPSVRGAPPPDQARGGPPARGREPLSAGARAGPLPSWVPVAAFLALQIAQLGAEGDALGWRSPPGPDGAVPIPALERGLAAYRVGLGRTVSYSGPVSPVDLLA